MKAAPSRPHWQIKVSLKLLGRRKHFEGEVECDCLNKRVADASDGSLSCSSFQCDWQHECIRTNAVFFLVISTIWLQWKFEAYFHLPMNTVKVQAMEMN